MMKSQSFKKTREDKVCPGLLVISLTSNITSELTANFDGPAGKKGTQIRAELHKQKHTHWYSWLHNQTT